MTASEEISGSIASRAEQQAEAAAAWFVRMRSNPVAAEDRDAFREWLAADPAHPSAYAEAEALWRELGAVPDPRARATSAAEAMPPLRPGRRPAGRPRRRLWPGALAACLAAALALGPWSAPAFDNLRADHVTGVGSGATVRLADGSTVELDTDTALAVEFTPTQRRIALYRGQAYFAVAADTDRPFMVTSGDAVATAVGTAFAVRREDEAISLAVTEGRVRLAARPDARRPEETDVDAGEAIRFEPRAGFAREAGTAEERTAWRDGRLVFADQSLRTVAEELDRYRPGRILFLDSAIADARFSGVIEIADTDAALATLTNTLPVEAVRITDYLTLLRPRR